ncbi:MAG: hypothetical protein V7632_4894 [Bradyrhizobium sp.]|jgi:hypothetical protein
MQDYSARRDPEERSVVRKWRLYVMSFYGSLIAILLLLSAIGDRPVQLARNADQPGVAGSAEHARPQAHAVVTP